jgi:pyrroloquinoline quinone biosynthesis protein D
VRLKYDPIEKGFVLLYPERGMVLNGSAADILQRCDGERTVPMIVAELAASSGGVRERIERDVVTFLEDMMKRGLVELS